MTAVHPDVARVGDIAGDYLVRIAALFKPGMRITLLVRHPDYADGSRDLVLTDDRIAPVIAALTLRMPADDIP